MLRDEMSGEDSSRRGVDKREVEVNLFDMAPMTEFQVEADGVFLGTITTDTSGWGSLKLETECSSTMWAMISSSIANPLFSPGAVHSRPQ